ncbi:hypothetical protein PIB30_038661 [Stylosanthes scabra]|uniref:Uncharacterized protein n=1 Tax=Stylosanthes scabra TaxID=79078 RepID=A0ABU6XBR4_9FABA|nr:hypothetical protein [Stylosanthes scabra]
MSEDEILRTLQQGNQETKEFNREAMIQLNQPLPNPKGGLNAINNKLESEEEAANTNNKEAVKQLSEALIEVPDTEEKDIGEILDFYEEFDSDYKEQECGEEKLAEGWGSNAETRNLQREMLSINTISDKKEDEEELLIKCEDPGPCLVTCRIKGFEMPGCLCDPGACGNIIPHVLYEA